MARCRSLLATIAAMLVLYAPREAFPGLPTEQLRGKIDQVINILKDPGLKAKEKPAERRHAIRGITDEIFDWTEMARRSLGPHWQGRTEAEREEFVRLLRDRLERAYISRIERYRGERIEYVGESADGDLAIVRTKIIPKQGQAVPVHYRMMRRSDRWLIYDVVIDHVSLVSNYRTQFNEIIRTSSYHELVKKMRDGK